MKHKLSITMDEEVVLKLFDRMRTKDFKNKSQAIEFAVKNFLDSGFEGGEQ